MKKNNTMRIAAGLAVAALLSTCLVSGTYAKYTTSGSSTDIAQVAKWGVKVAADGGSAFSDKYAKDDQTSTITGDSVVAQGHYDVVAPGTTGTFKAATVSGKPEVAVRVDNEAKITLNGWNIPTDHPAGFYCPLTFKVNGTAVDLSKCDSVEAVQNAVQKAVAATSKNYAAGTVLSSDNSVNIDWAWAFESDGDEAAKKANDEKDTALGDLAAAPTISIAVTTTVTQID